MLCLLHTASGVGTLGLYWYCFLHFPCLLSATSPGFGNNSPQGGPVRLGIATSFVLDGLRNSFKLGFHPQLLLKSAPKNKPSAYQQPLAIDEYLAYEVSQG